MMKKLKLSYSVAGVNHVCSLPMLPLILSACEGNYIMIRAVRLQSHREKHPSAPFLK